MNIRLILEYDGTDFHGWQRQGDLPTIQKLIEETLTGIVGKPVTVYGSSRTDSGVHARGQVVTFYADGPVPSDRWHLALNKILPPTVRAVSSTEMPEKFFSQRGSTSKIYEYRVLNRSFASALDRRVYFFPRPLDWARMREVLPLFVGRKDFRAFQGAKATVKTTVREVMRFELFDEGNGYHRFEVEGSGFLKQMVRTMVGTVMEVGQGKRSPSEIESLFSSLKRTEAGRTVPASGLCLVRVNYC